MPKLKRVDDKYLFLCLACGYAHIIDINYSNVNVDLDNPTFDSSVRVETKFRNREVCNFLIKEGKIEYLMDSTHHLSGKTVDMIEVI